MMPVLNACDAGLSAGGLYAFEASSRIDAPAAMSAPLVGRGGRWPALNRRLSRT
jgi:hypothetical protein